MIFEGVALRLHLLILLLIVADSGIQRDQRIREQTNENGTVKKEPGNVVFRHVSDSSK